MRIIILRVAPFSFTEPLYKIGEGLTKAFHGVTCIVAEEAIPIPRRAFNPQRKQYHSTVILRKICNYSKELICDRVLGVAEVDLYVPQLNFVFGEAVFNGRGALISLHRLRPEFYGEPASEKVLYERSVKEAVHEIGHTFGLTHCDNKNCVMFFSNSIIDTDRKKASFCGKCDALAKKKLE
ncbi:MAG: archaemetzincin family Zn-dependent metalloprotease [Candidatus Bathyarchaeia archaeon]